MGNLQADENIFPRAHRQPQFVHFPPRPNVPDGIGVLREDQVPQLDGEAEFFSPPRVRSKKTAKTVCSRNTKKINPLLWIYRNIFLMSQGKW